MQPPLHAPDGGSSSAGLVYPAGFGLTSHHSFPLQSEDFHSGPVCWKHRFAAQQRSP